MMARPPLQCALVVIAATALLAATPLSDAAPIAAGDGPRTCESVLQVLCVSTTRTATSCGMCAGQKQQVLREVGCGSADISRYCAIPRGSSATTEPYRVANLIYEGPRATNPLRVFAYDSAGGKSLFVADSGQNGGDCRDQAIYQ